MAVEDALNQKLRMTRGDTDSWSGQVVDPDNNDAPVDITGYAMTWTVKRSYSDADSEAVIRKTVGSGITFTAPVTGVFRLGPLLPTDTSGFEDSVVGFVFDVQIVDLTGGVRTCAKGTLTVHPDSTRS